MQLLKPWSFNKHLLSSYYWPGTLLSTDDSKMRKILKSYPFIDALVENTMNYNKKWLFAIKCYGNWRNHQEIRKSYSWGWQLKGEWEDKQKNNDTAHAWRPDRYGTFRIPMC